MLYYQIHGVIVKINGKILVIIGVIVKINGKILVII